LGTVLVVTNQDDLHASAVIEQLNAMGASVFRLNTEHLLTHYRLGLFQDPIKGDTLSIRHLSPERTVTFSTIGSVYFRRPAPVEPPPSMTDEAAMTIVASESNHLLKWLYAYLEPKWWFASFATLERLKSKPIQIRAARNVGLSTLPTFYGNDSELCAPLSAVDTLAIKSIREMGFTDGEVYRSFYTSMVPASILLGDPASVEINSNFFQQRSEKAYELRITYVNGRIIAVKIDSQNGPKAAKEDWRTVDWKELDYELVQLDSTLQDRIHALMRSLGLRFGALDFIVTPDGRTLFLEVNANGQWLWLDEMTDAGIARAIAEELAAAAS